jgi:hypothetical protein
MNKLITLIFIAFAFGSCGLMRRANEKYIEESAAGLDKSKGTFVMMRDSTIVPYDAMKIKSPLFGKSKFILDGGNEILLSAALAYQTEFTYTTTTSLCGWTTRRIELAPISKYQGSYTTQEYQAGSGTGASSGGRWKTVTRNKLYIQKGNNSLIEYTPKNLFTLVSDYAPSIELIDEYNKQKKHLRAVGWANTGLAFVSLVMIGSYNETSNIKKIVPLIGFGGLVGTITYGFINRKKKSRNYAKVDEAYEEYNWYHKRKK